MLLFMLGIYVGGGIMIAPGAIIHCIKESYTIKEILFAGVAWVAWPITVTWLIMLFIKECIFNRID